MPTNRSQDRGCIGVWYPAEMIEPAQPQQFAYVGAGAILELEAGIGNRWVAISCQGVLPESIGDAQGIG